MHSVVWMSVEPSEQLSVVAGVMEESGGDVVVDPTLENRDGEGVCWGMAIAVRAEERTTSRDLRSILLYLISANYCDYYIERIFLPVQI